MGRARRRRRRSNNALDAAFSPPSTSTSSSSKLSSLRRISNLARQFSSTPAALTLPKPQMTTPSTPDYKVDADCVFCKIISEESPGSLAGGALTPLPPPGGKIPSFKLIETDKT